MVFILSIVFDRRRLISTVLEAIGYKFLQYGGPLYKFEVALEEFMEMSGASLVLYFAITLASSSVESEA